MLTIILSTAAKLTKLSSTVKSPSTPPDVFGCLTNALAADDSSGLDKSLLFSFESQIASPLGHISSSPLLDFCLDIYRALIGENPLSTGNKPLDRAHRVINVMRKQRDAEDMLSKLQWAVALPIHEIIRILKTDPSGIDDIKAFRIIDRLDLAAQTGLGHRPLQIDSTHMEIKEVSLGGPLL